MPDENDIVFEQYQLDLVGIVRFIYEAFGGSGVGFDTLLAFLNTLWFWFTVVSFLFAILCLIGLIYAWLRGSHAGDLESAGLKNLEKLYQEIHHGEVANNRWLDIEKHIAGDNPNDWRLAIIEADIMLEDLLNNQGFAGNTIGEKLKSASPENFKTLDEAWRAHRVRNQIAHQGSDFVLTKRIAQETITQYRKVFQEFNAI